MPVLTFRLASIVRSIFIPLVQSTSIVYTSVRCKSMRFIVIFFSCYTYVRALGFGVLSVVKGLAQLKSGELTTTRLNVM